MKHFRYWPIFMAMCLALAPLVAQEAGSRPDTGIIYGAEYVNSYFGFSYRFPAGWSASAARANMATPIYPLFTATPSAAGDGRYVAIEAERIRQDGSIRTGKDFLAMSVDMLTGPSSGFDALPGDKRYNFGGREFDRIDLRSKAAPGSPVIRQAVVATVVHDYAVKFLLKASSDADLEELVRTLESLSFLDSRQTPSPSAPARTVSQPLAAANTSMPPAPAPAVSSSARVVPQPAPSAVAAKPAVTPAAGITTPVSAEPAISTPPATTTFTAHNVQPGTGVASNTPPLSASARVAPQPEARNASAPAGAPSTLIKMENAPHTIPGDTLPSTEVQAAPQPLVKTPAKADQGTKTAVMQAVMPAPSATMSPAALNASPSASSPAVPAPAPSASQPVVRAQPPPSPTPAERKPAFTMQTEITRVQISGETLESYVIHKAPAAYPLLARQARIEGLVVLTIVVNEKGEVQDVKAVSGPALLARSAEDALRHWRFKPIIIDGKPTAIESRVSMNFQFPH